MTEQQTVRVVFMGTPDFAVPTLRALINSNYDVVAAVTQPDRPRGRGHHVSPSPVKSVAIEHGIPVIQMDRISSPAGIDAVSAYRPDYLVTASFGQILSEKLLEVPNRGTINVHASLLPAYRGASPVVHAIMNGEHRTGVTTMFTVREVDAGPILLQGDITIGDRETSGQLMPRLAELGAGLLIETLDGLESGRVKPVPQDSSQATHAPLLQRGYGQIDWNQPAHAVVNFIRALSPVPGAYFLLGDEKVGVLEASVDKPTNAQAGTIVAADPKCGLLVATMDRLVSLDVIRRRGSRAMPASDSLHGRRIDAQRLWTSPGDAV